MQRLRLFQTATIFEEDGKKFTKSCLIVEPKVKKKSCLKLAQNLSSKCQSHFSKGKTNNNNNNNKNNNNNN